MKALREFWQTIVTSRRTRERDVAARIENVLRESALQDDFAKRTQALEARVAQACAEIDRLRAENRALLNSVLGIAGIPPVIVAETADFPPAAAPTPNSRHPERKGFWSEGSLFVSPDCLDENPKRDPSSPMKPASQDDGAMSEGARADSAASPKVSAEHGDAMLASDRLPVGPAARQNNAAMPQKQARSPRAASDPHAIAPVRRRSWHQIYRMLEFESSRRKDRET